MKTIKVKAFTVMEIIIVMLLSAITLSITFKSYELIAQTFLSYHLKQTRLIEMTTVQRLLSLDFIRCQKISREGDRLVFIRNKERTEYVFNPSYIERKQGQLSDTFLLSVAGSRFIFKGREITAPYALVDELLLTVRTDHTETSFQCFKRYGADILIAADTTLQN